jgi:hypothetical protein
MQDDNELLDEQLMLRALLAEAEDDPQIEFNETAYESALEATPAPPPQVKAPAQPQAHKQPEKNIEKSKPVTALITANAAPTNHSVAIRTDQLDIKIDMSLGFCILKYPALNSLKPGHVFHLNKNFSSPISLYSHNTLIGSAEIVDIDGEVGVRVVTINSK